MSRKVPEVTQWSILIKSKISRINLSTDYGNAFINLSII
jgi:hypothetical protein